MTILKPVAHVYLAGRMVGLPDRGAGWREEAAAKLSPLVAEDPVKLELDSRDPQHIVVTDIAAICRSRCVLAAVGVTSWGTAMELWQAKQLSVPVIGWLPEGFDETLSPWLRYVLDELHYGKPGTHGLDSAIASVRARLL